MADSLKYSRGSLSVLDQLLLPHETKYLPVLGVNDAWTVIRTMQVRGAPLIAITAVLGLAVELESRKAELTQSKDGLISFLQTSIEYLRTSRPTAVNLFIAMDELSALVSTASADTSVSAEGVLTQVVEASEKIWADDILTNRSIGYHGAHKILELVQRDSIRVLTICNTGSLATAGFGTALGVVRALHELGKLEHVYACETRPYNQGARLTAYEIVQDGLPGTLITDNMASALMAVKGVDVVVVGADRVAANGDTANKIGTYQLAIAAKYHRIPFFTAAPTTTIDVTIASGIEIHVEERPAHELTSIFGQRIAPDGIGVWNPAFDVTPCALITGIVTELGVITPEFSAATATASQNSDPLIPVGEYLRTAAEADPVKHRNILQRLEKAATPVSTPIGYARMDAAHIRSYIAQQGVLTRILNLTTPEDIANINETVDVKEVGDGNLNFVYIVTGKNNARLVIKQALPFVRCIGEGWPMTLERASFEHKALLHQAKLTGGEYVPKIFHFDHAKALMAMEYVPPPHIILRKALIANQRLSTVARDLGIFVAKTLFGSSGLALSGGELRRGVAEWSRNYALCALTEKVIFTDPYTSSPLNRWTSPHLDATVQSIRTDDVLKRAIAHFKQVFLTSTQALLHADLHTGSVMVAEGSTFVIDPEFAFYGPMGFDIGALLSNLLLSYFAHSVRSSDSDYANWILEQIVSFHDTFLSTFENLWAESIRTTGGLGEFFAAGLYSAETLVESQQEFLRSLWRDTLGFTGAKMIRRVVGVAHVEDIESIEDLALRAQAEERALAFARVLLTTAHANTQHVTGLGDVRGLVAQAKTYFARV